MKPTKGVELVPESSPSSLILGHLLLLGRKDRERLIPSDPLASARTYQWRGEAASDMGPTAQNIFFLGNRMPESVLESAIKFYENRLVTQFRASDEQLGHTSCLAGSEITVADLGLYPVYAGRKALIDGAGLKNVTVWGERVGARPDVQKGMRLESWRPRVEDMKPWPQIDRGTSDVLRVMAFPDLQSAVGFPEIDCANPIVSHAGD